MASLTRYPKDRGLSARMLTTVFLIGLLYAVFVAILVAVHVQVVLIVVLAVGILSVQYFFSDKIALYSMGGRLVERAQAPQLFAVIDRLVAMADMPMPRIALAQTDLPNAFATGRNQKHAVVCVTSGLLRRLDEQELEAVLAHELSHVAHNDVAVMTIASFLGIMAGLMTRMFYYAGIFGGFDDNNNNGGGAAIELGMVLFSAVIYAISFLLIRALSRYRELAADRAGALLIGQPALLARALQKVSGEIARIPTRDLRAAEHFNAFYFAPALARGASLSSLFSTHPSLEKRLEQLAKLDAELRSQLS
ncbi:MAG: zinc metalloprotease HtpX [Actinomycetota bacterium]|jgi:heat shock protein HtpX|nr:zinc metalloprotease HtpX [Actinomycetota bacterium]